MTNPSVPSSSLRLGQIMHNFRITRIVPLELQACLAIEAEHTASGAKLLHLLANDDENLFAIAFKTPPTDNTGMPHIIEHSVLGGSEKYPVKDPFVELLKMSMATFINAMTYDDRTVYPVASNVRQDFFNLADVYCDAVFHPKISRTTLMQEGHHTAFADPHNPQSPLIIKGIVYNEMKGAYSSPDSLMMRTAAKMLLPDSPYGRDAGGDPDAIPDLDYERFIAFYKALYHPANARIFLYGDIDTAEHLKFIDQRLSDCPPPPESIPNDIAIQPRWESPRTHIEPCPVDDDDDPETKASVSIHWALGAFTAPDRDFAWEVLDRLLLGNLSAPLYKALMRSGYGRDLACGGYCNESLEKIFEVGLKGTSCYSHEAIVDLIMNTLAEIVAQGFDQESIDTAFHQLQYSHREIQSNYPLRLMEWAYSTWIYDGDPLDFFSTPIHLANLQKEVHDNPAFFTSMIQRELLDNPHRLTLIMKPEADLQRDRDEAFTRKMENLKRSLSPAELELIKRQSIELEELQNRSNSPEDLATLPHLLIEDIPEIPRPLPFSIAENNKKHEMIRLNLHTNGINYTHLSFDLAGLPEDLWMYIPAFCNLLTRLGTTETPFDIMAKRLAGNTGGCHAATLATTGLAGPDAIIARVNIQLKAIDTTYERALGLVTELLFKADFTDRERVAEFLAQTLERLNSILAPAGHVLAGLHAGRNISQIAALNELWDGLPQIRLHHALVNQFDQKYNDFVEKMERIRSFMLGGVSAKLAFAGSDANADTAHAWLAQVLPTASRSLATTAFPTANDESFNSHEGLIIPADVSYCAECLRAPHYSSAETPALSLICHMLGLGYFWDNIRVKGGAYGGGCHFDGAAETIKLFSYRDPAILNTFNVFDHVVEAISHMPISNEDLDRAKIGCLRGDEIPIRPNSGTSRALMWRLAGITEEFRRNKRSALLECTSEQVRQMSIDVFTKGLEQGRRCVLGSRRRLEEVNRTSNTKLTIENIIPQAKKRVGKPAK